MLEYIRLHCYEKLTLQDLSRALGYSEDYLSRLFHESARCSFRSYVHQLRLARAKRELLGSVKSIQQIAESCGYSNAKFFSTVFLKQEGVDTLRLQKPVRRASPEQCLTAGYVKLNIRRKQKPFSANDTYT